MEGPSIIVACLGRIIWALEYDTRLCAQHRRRIAVSNTSKRVGEAMDNNIINYKISCDVFRGRV